MLWKTLLTWFLNVRFDHVSRDFSGLFGGITNLKNGFNMPNCCAGYDDRRKELADSLNYTIPTCSIRQRRAYETAIERLPKSATSKRFSNTKISRVHNSGNTKPGTISETIKVCRVP